MPTTVYETLEIELSDGHVIKVKPLTITNLKKFLEITNKINDESITTEEQVMDIFIQAGMLCMQQFYPEIASDRQKFEDVIEVPTLMKVLEIAGGLKLNTDDPNSLGANLAGNL